MDTLRELDVVRASDARIVLTGSASIDEIELIDELVDKLNIDERALDDDEAAEDPQPLMEVRFSRFGTWYEIDSYWEGTFLERTARGAFKKTIAENGANVKVLFNHGMDFFIGDKILGATEDLREAKDSPVGLVRMFDTRYNDDLLPGLRAGVYGSSFMFRVIRDEWNDEPGASDHNPKGLPERTIKEVKLYEFGPVTFPANPESTAGIRSMTDEYYAQLRARDPRRVDELFARTRSLRTPMADAVEREVVQLTSSAPVLLSNEPTTSSYVQLNGGLTSTTFALDTSTNGAARAQTDAPDDNEEADASSSHPSGLTPSQRAARLREIAHPFLIKEAS